MSCVSSSNWYGEDVKTSALPLFFRIVFGARDFSSGGGKINLGEMANFEDDLGIGGGVETTDFISSCFLSEETNSCNDTVVGDTVGDDTAGGGTVGSDTAGDDTVVGETAGSHTGRSLSVVSNGSYR